MTKGVQRGANDRLAMLRDNAMDARHGIQITRGFILKTIQWHIHAGSWSLVNCLVGSPYKALYKVLMNIN